MQKKSKIMVAFIIILAVVICSFAGMIFKRSNDHKFGYYVLTQGPWSTDGNWVSDDGTSVLQCSKAPDIAFATIMAHFTVDGEEHTFQLNCIDRLAYLDRNENGVIGETYSAHMKFDGNEFILYDLDKDVFGQDEFHYFLSDGAD